MNFSRIYGYVPSESMFAAYNDANARMGVPHRMYADGPRTVLGSKAQLREILRASGLPKAAAEKIAAAGWPAISPEARAAETAAAIRAAAARLKA